MADAPPDREQVENPKGQPTATEQAAKPKMSRFSEWVAHTWGEIWRVRWIIIILVGAVFLRLWGYLHPTSPLTVIVMRPVGPCLDAIIAHVFRTQVFPYVNLGDMMGYTKPSGEVVPPHPAVGAVFVGICLIYAAFIIAGALAFGV